MLPAQPDLFAQDLADEGLARVINVAELVYRGRLELVSAPLLHAAEDSCHVMPWRPSGV